MSTIVPLVKAREEGIFGAKAVGLGQGARAGIDIPPGIALSGPVVDAVAAGDERVTKKVVKAARDLPRPLAVRSSAVDEDGADASFAGQHLTLLNVFSSDDLVSALRDIWWSANSDSAITYRKRVGLFTRPSIAVVVQSLLDPDVAGVMFTRNPINGADERLIEASWGLGEVVVAGRVIPDHFRLDKSGKVLERTAGVKKVAVRTLPDGGTEERAVEPDLVEKLCLDDDDLAKLADLAEKCEASFGPARDIEWAILDKHLYLLQCRAVTTSGTSSANKPGSPAQPAPESTMEILERVPLFENLSSRDMEHVAHLFKERTFSAGETVTKEGAGGAAFFVIQSGEATVTAHGKQVATLSAGDYFGEIALIDEGARTATITANTDLVCLGLTYWEFRPLVQHNATIAGNLLQTVAKRLRGVLEL